MIRHLVSIRKPYYQDNRGFMHEIFLQKDLPLKKRKEFKIMQFNHSRSVIGVLRGIHISPWTKLVYVPNGMVQVVVVDCRKKSKSYGQYVSRIMGDGIGETLYIPPNCGFGFLTLSETADVVYAIGKYWRPLKEKGIIWNDPTLKIPWQVPQPILSAKDKNNKTFAEL